jgi:protein-S-isoprenylcysteine O-methyltransferase Ste14
MTVPSRSFWVRWRVASGYLLAIISFYFARPNQESLLEGACIALVGLMIRAAAAGIVRKGQQLASSGIYAWTRNPLYFGSSILAAGFVVGSNSRIVAGVVSAYILMFYPVVVRREDRDLRERFGAEFAAYSARVSAFIPWPTRQPSGAPGFSWTQYVRNHEYRATVGTAIAMGVLVLRMWLLMKYGK